jgi:signal peptidase
MGMPRLARRIAAIGSWLMVSVAVATAIGFVVMTTAFKWQFSTVLTGSMTPKYPVGSMVVIVPVQPVEIKVGDVITFTAEDRRISHRVMTIEDGPSGRAFVTKGDANNVRDQHPVPQENVVGRVMADIPWLGDLLLWIRTPLGMGVTASVCAGSLFFGASNRKRRDPART